MKLRWTVLRKMKYRDTHIYVVHFQYIFQYLIPWESEVYQDHVTIKPKLWKRFLYKIGAPPRLYTKEQLEQAEQILLSGAMQTIDHISSPEYLEKKRKAEEARRKVNERVKTTCTWQAREGTDGFYYVCLEHHEAIKIKEGEKPYHQI